MCQVPKAFRKNSFLIALLTAIEEKTGWKEQYREYEFMPLEQIPPKMHFPSRAKINDAVMMLEMMIKKYSSEPENEQDIATDKKLFDNIELEFSDDIDYAANAVINFAQIIALRVPFISQYLGLAKLMGTENVSLNSNLWKVVLDVTVNMLITNLRGFQFSDEHLSAIFNFRIEELSDKLREFIIEKKAFQLSRLHFEQTLNPVNDTSNPWLYYLEKSRLEKLIKKYHRGGTNGGSGSSGKAKKKNGR